MWKWNGTIWTWMHGNNTINVIGIYGIQGIPSSMNHPGSRTGCMSWSENNSFWIFGGNSALG